MRLGWLDPIVAEKGLALVVSVGICAQTAIGVQHRVRASKAKPQQVFTRNIGLNWSINVTVLHPMPSSAGAR
jgi:putative copper export protein